MKRKLIGLACAMAFASMAHADVVLMEKDSARSSHQVKLGDKLQREALAKQRGPGIDATGSFQLTDASGLQYFVNTNITFSTTSSASGAASEASYAGPVQATTSAGGFTASTLNDAFDGYNTMCVSLTGATGPCATGNPSFTIYNQNGAPTLDSTCGGRQALFAAQTIGGLSVTRQVYVPATDEFARWLNVFTNTTGASISFAVSTGNNLGSDANTALVTSSDGDAVAETTDTWITSFQNYSGTTSSDVRLGHVLQGVGVSAPVSAITFVDGDDNPSWTYNLTLAPGATAIIANFVTGQPTKADAAAKAAELAAFPASAQACMTAPQLAQVANFTAVAAGPARAVPVGNRDGWVALAGLMTLLAMFALRPRQ
jgi:hypothetical protein